MKKVNIRYFITIILVTISISSYTYLSCVATTCNGIVPVHSTISEEEDGTEQKTYFPDITIFQKFFTIGKKLANVQAISPMFGLLLLPLLFNLKMIFVSA